MSEICVKPENDTYKFKLPIQIRFSDLDALNHVNNSFHAQYYDLGRINYFEKVMGEGLDWSEVCVVIVNTDTNFFSPIFQSDKLWVETKLVKFGNKSMTTHQRLIDDKGIVKGTCKTILAGFDAQNHCSAPIDEDFKRRFLEFEATE
jgi:acyl-CoA thioester hydrolase